MKFSEEQKRKWLLYDDLEVKLELDGKPIYATVDVATDGPVVPDLSDDPLPPPGLVVEITQTWGAGFDLQGEEADRYFQGPAYEKLLKVVEEALDNKAVDYYERQDHYGPR